MTRAKEMAAAQRRNALRKRWRYRNALRAKCAEYRPLIGTYSEAVELGVVGPPIPPIPRYKPQEFYTPCPCRVCRLAQQSQKAKENALRRKEQKTQAQREQERIARKSRRHYCRVQPVEAHPVAWSLALLLEQPWVDEEKTVPVKGRIVNLSKKQVKTSWKNRAQPFDWDEFEGGAEVVSEKRRRPRVVRRKLAAKPEEVAPTVANLPKVFEFLKPEALKRRVAALPPQDVVLSVQMMEENGSPPEEEQHGNVVLQEGVEPEVEIIGHQLGNLRKYCEADTTSLPSDMDRWITFESFTWSKTAVFNSVIMSHAMPYRAIYDGSQKMYENVFTNMLRVRRFIQTDFEVRVVLNSMPFNVGQLQLGFLYAGNLDHYEGLRGHCAAISQMDHVIVDASQANSASLVIPYRSYQPYMSIEVKETDFGDALTLGSLYLYVLNPLVLPAGGPNSVDGVVMIRFTNCTMTGMVPPGLTKVETQMFTAMNAVAAANWLYQRYADSNRDAPPNPHAPHPVVPSAVGNLAIGTNYVEPLSSMRLDAKGQTPHPEGVPDQMTVPYITGKFGYVETIEIPATAVGGTLVCCYDAAPVLEKKHYRKIERSGIDCYYLPPVAVVAQLFAYWRGEIEFRFDFVATRFHQMRLLFVWVPGYYGPSITYQQAMSCAGTYFDLKEDNRSVCITVPYVADRPWWPHRYSNGVDAESVKPPGIFCCFIVNRLTYSASVPNKIEMNCYMRAGPSFEVAVPIQPTIGLGYVPDVINESDVSVRAVPGYFPWYAGTWRYVKGGTKLVLRYGPVSDHIAQFYGLQRKTYYKFKNAAVAATFTFVLASGTVVSGSSLIFVPVDTNDGYGRAYLGVLKDSNQDTINNYFFVQDSKTKKWTPRADTAVNYDLLYDGTVSDATYYTPSDLNAELVPTQVPSPPGDFVMVEGDNREKVISGIKFESQSLVEASRETFGEDFSSLKDLCRRYQPYLQMPTGSIDNIPGHVNFAFPMLPTGLDLHPLVNGFSNSCRDGIIPIVLSGYRFFRGGLRFKFVPSVSDILMYVVQVKPDRPIVSCNPRAGGRTIADSLIQHGYATSAQCTSVNPVLSVEVPFYIPGSAGLLCRPSVAAKASPEQSRFFSLGDLAVSCQVPSKASAVIKDAFFTIMYCVADDFSAHTFQGFPPMMFIKDAKTS